MDMKRWDPDMPTSINNILASYMKACSLSDPNFRQCCKESAASALPHVVKGDKKYGAVSSMPLVIPEVVLSSPNMVLKLKNLTIAGLENTKFVDVDYDVTNNKGQIITEVDKTTYDADYEIDGQVMVLPIKGSGKAHFELFGSRTTYEFQMEHFTKGGVEYIKLVNPTAKYTLKNMSIHLDNLFNGDERLGNEMNKVLNENWEIINEDLSETMGKTNAEVCFSIANAYFTKVPLKEIFPD